MHLGLITTFIRFCYSARISKELGTVYLSPNEVYQANLYDYFEGSFLNFSLDPETSSFTQIKNNWNLDSLNALPLIQINKTDPVIISTYASKVFDYAISALGLNVTYFIMSVTTGSGQKFLTIHIPSNLIDAKITKAIIQSSFILIIVNGKEINETFYVNELWYIDTLFIRVRVRNIPIWDLRYVENLNMKFTVISYIIFWGTLYGKHSIFSCSFDLSKLVVKQQINQFLEYKSLTPFYLDILDLDIYLNKLIILQKDLGLVIFQESNVFYIENSVISLKSYGRPINLSNSNNQFTSLLYFGVVMDSCIIVFEYIFIRIRFVISFNFESNIYLQIFSPYLFVFLPKNLEIYYFRDFEYSTLHSIPFEYSQSTVSVLQNLNGFSIVKQNKTEIEFLSLNFTLALLQVRGIANQSVTVLAQDGESKIQSTISVNMIEDLYAAHMINNYRETKFGGKDVYFNSLNSSSGYNLFGIVSGWNLTADLQGSEQELLSYNFSVTFPYTKIANFTIDQDYFAVLYYYSSLYFINYNGLYCNNSLILSNLNPLNMTAGGELVQVLYPNNITFYNIIKKEFSYSQIDSNCSSIFKFVGFYTFCADYEKLLIINLKYNDPLIYFYSFITNNETIIDVCMYQNSLLDTDFIYFLTQSKVYYYNFNSQSLILLFELKTTGIFIICAEPYVFVIGSEVQVFDLQLDTLLKVIPLPGTPSSVFNNFYLIYAQIEDSIYLINGDSPVVQSLVDTIPAKNCQFYYSFLNALSVCNKTAYLYSDKCEKLCYKLIYANFYLKNSLVIDKGISFINVSTDVIGLNSSIEFNCLYELYTYSFYLLFNDSEIRKSTVFNYDKQMVWPIEYDFIGFDIEYELFINESRNIDPNFPIVLKPRVANQTYFEVPEYAFIDHEVIPGVEIVLILCNDSIIVINNSIPDGSTTPYRLKILKSIPQSEYFNGSGNCQSINYISSKGDYSLFVLNCNQTQEFMYYHRNTNTAYEYGFQFLVFFELDSRLFQVSSVYSHGYNHEIDWIQIVTSSSSCFMVLCIDKIDESALIYSINNMMIVYSGSWFDSIKVSHEISISFFKLNIERLEIINADGVYISTPKCSSMGTLYLYVSDLYYGVRVLKVTNKTVELQSSVDYGNEYVLSIAVCGTSVFCMSNLTYIDEYFIDKSHNLSFYQTIPPSFNSKLKGEISYLTCSSYYRPDYLAVYLLSKEHDYYQLRLIDVNSISFSSYFKFINLPVGNSLSYRGKSRFTTKSVVTALGVDSGEFYSFLISDIELYFKSMTESEYNLLIDKYKSNVFELFIQYRNQYLAKNTTKFIFHIIDPLNSSSDSDPSISTWWIWVVASIVLASVAIVSFIIYKRIINRKKKQDLALKTFIVSTELGQKGRLGLLINHEDTLNNY